MSYGAQKNFVHFAGWMAKRWVENDSAFDEHYFRNLVAMAILFRHAEHLVKQQPWYTGAYRPNIVTYTLAVLQFTILKSGKGRQLDLEAIWNAQAVPPAVSSQMIAIAGTVFNVLTSPSRGKTNVTEWAKSEACWERAREVVVPLSDAILNEMVDPIAKRYTDAGALSQIGYGVFARTAVLGVNTEEWELLREWGGQKALLDAKDAALLRTASRLPKFVPSVRECERIWAVRSRLIKHGFGAVKP
ncbi:hypothetical protein ASF04_26165 [Duganella sp. Leaf61]|nr:hypothetical protein ASF04_26165 [Duganella sp. Leaf61]